MNAAAHPNRRLPKPPAERHAAACLGRKLRLHDGKQFSAVYEHKLRAHGKFFSVHFAPNAERHARLGMTVSRRVSKKAVARNRLKRLIRESFRVNWGRLGRRDFIVVAKRDAVAEENRELRAELEVLWGRVRRSKRMAGVPRE